MASTHNLFVWVQRRSKDFVAFNRRKTSLLSIMQSTFNVFMLKKSTFKRISRFLLDAALAKLMKHNIKYSLYSLISLNVIYRLLIWIYRNRFTDRGIILLIRSMDINTHTHNSELQKRCHPTYSLLPTYVLTRRTAPIICGVVTKIFHHIP